MNPANRGSWYKDILCKDTLCKKVGHGNMNPHGLDQQESHQQQRSRKRKLRAPNPKEPGLQKRKLGGFTLIELMICLSLIGALSSLLAPRLMETMPELTLERQTHQLQSLLSNARIHAMVNRTSTFVCPATQASLNPLAIGSGSADEWCDPHGNWHTGINIVLDSDADGAAGTTDSLVLQLNWHTGQGGAPRVLWRGFRDNGQIEFLPSGMTNWQNGRFMLCSRAEYISGRTLVLNAAGRSYIERLASEDCDF